MTLLCYTQIDDKREFGLRVISVSGKAQYMTRVYFVRHAQPEHSWADDRTRPLTHEGLIDALKVSDFIKLRNVDNFYCSPCVRSIQTIENSAKTHGREMIINERLKERESGPDGNNHEMYHKRWGDK